MSVSLRGADWPSWSPVEYLDGSTISGSTAYEGEWQSNGSVIQHRHVAGEDTWAGLVLIQGLHGGVWRCSVEIQFPVGRSNDGNPRWECFGLGYGYNDQAADALNTQRDSAGLFLQLNGDGLGNLMLGSNTFNAATAFPSNGLTVIGSSWAEGDWIHLDVTKIGNDLMVLVDGESVAILGGGGNQNSGGARYDWLGLASMSLAGTAYGDGAYARNFRVSEPEWSFL